MNTDRTNGFKIRALNADCDRLAIQSNTETTWPLGRGSKARGPQGKWHEVALAQNELKVLRAYGAAPSFELEALGDRAGLLITQRSRGATRAIRVGQRVRFEMLVDESLVLRCEMLVTPLGTPIPY